MAIAICFVCVILITGFHHQAHDEAGSVILIALGVCNHVIQCLRIPSPDVKTNALQAMMNLARDDGGAFTRAGACQILLQMLPQAAKSESPVLMVMLDCMYALGLHNPTRQKQLEAAKVPLMNILAQRYKNPEIHKKAVVIASLLAYSTRDMKSFLPLVHMIRSYYHSMPKNVPDPDPHTLNVRRVCAALLIRYNCLEGAQR